MNIYYKNNELQTINSDNATRISMIFLKLKKFP
jgi:hypothetical protein